MARNLAASGTELPALMQAGRWKSERMPALYTRNEAAGRGASPGTTNVSHLLLAQRETQSGELSLSANSFPLRRNVQFGICAWVIGRVIVNPALLDTMIYL